MTYRLANLRNGAYLYTIDPAEQAAAAASGLWRAEGVAFSSRPTSLQQCTLTVVGSTSVYLTCKDLSKTPWAVGSFTGTGYNAQTFAQLGACSAQVNSVGDISMSVNGVSYQSRLDASTIDDAIVIDAGSSPSASVFADNPLNGSTVSALKSSLGISFFYRASTTSSTINYGCSISSQVATGSENSATAKSIDVPSHALDPRSLAQQVDLAKTHNQNRMPSP